MRIFVKIMLIAMLVMMIMASTLSIFLVGSLAVHTEHEIQNIMEVHLNILENEYLHIFENMGEITHVISGYIALIEEFENYSHDDMHILFSNMLEGKELDFVIIVNPDKTVFHRSNSNVFGDSTPFPDLVEDALLGDIIKTTEIVPYNFLARENIDVPTNIGNDNQDSGDALTSAMMQLYLAPIYDNGNVKYVVILGRLINGRSDMLDELDYAMFEGTTTVIYQQNRAVATNSKPESEALLGTVLDTKSRSDLQAHISYFGEIEMFSATYIYAAAPIENHAGNVIGALVISHPKAPFAGAIQRAKETIITAIIVGMFVSIIIVSVGSRSITKPLKNLSEAAAHVSSMSGYRNVDITTNDEVADVSRSFNMMVDSLRETDEATRENTKELLFLNSSLKEKSVDLQKKQTYETAYSDILTSVSKTMDLNTILGEGLNNLMEYTKSITGVFYLYDSNSQMLLPAVTQGTTSDVSEHSYTLGEGIPGKAALKRDTIVIYDVAPDNIYRIDAGVYNAHPSTIVSTPMIFEDKLIGIMVTSHLSDVSEDMVNFINRVVNQYAIAVNNANILMETQDMAGELKKQRDELDTKSKELIVVSRTKSEFLANMSHELRTPLNSIIGFSEILYDETFGPLNKKQSKYINNIMTSGKHLLRLINNILDLSKIEAGKMELNYEIFSVSDAINEITTLTSSLASKKGIGVSTVVGPEITTINADLGKFKQILFNIISNSIKFTPESGTLSVEAQRAGDMAQISITDTGIGISKEDHKKIFKAFTQADASNSRQYGGTGLGLSLVKQFVNIHGGDVWIESELDKGSTFIFTIPIDQKVKDPKTEAIEKTEMPPVEKIMATDKSKTVEVKIESIGVSVTEEDIANVEMPAIIEPEDALGNEPLILVVEDDKEASEILINMLIEAGYRAVPAYTGIEAMAIAQKLKPLAITLDIMLPGMNGWTVLKHLKYKSETSRIPVIIISMYDEKDVGFVLGAVDYFIKPVQKDLFITSLDHLRDLLHIEKPKVLIVDDDANAVELIASMLEPVGFEVLRAYSGQEGLDKVMSEKPDVLVLDLMMSVVDGFDFVAKLKNHPETTDMPIIICTAKDYDEDLGHLATEASHVLHKGMINKDELIDAIKKSTTLQRD